MRTLWYSNYKFNWSITQEVMNYFSFDSFEVFNQSTIIRSDGVPVKPGPFLVNDLSVYDNPKKTNLSVNASGTPIPVEDPDKGNGYRWLLPTCTMEYVYTGATGDCLLEFNINCNADARWRQIFDFTNDPTVFSMLISPIEGCELVGNAIKVFYGPTRGARNFNRFCVIFKQIIKVYSVPSKIRLHFTFQVAASQQQLKDKTTVPLFMEAQLNWRSYLNSFSRPRGLDGSSLDLVVE